MTKKKYNNKVNTIRRCINHEYRGTDLYTLKYIKQQCVRKDKIVEDSNTSF